MKFFRHVALKMILKFSELQEMINNNKEFKQ